MKKYDNICKYIYLFVQFGNSCVFDLMNWIYDWEWYMDKVCCIYEIMFDCVIFFDIIVGFCSEMEEEYQEILSMIEFVNYSMFYMFYYLECFGILAVWKYEDDILFEVKKCCFQEIICL